MWKKLIKMRNKKTRWKPLKRLRNNSGIVLIAIIIITIVMSILAIGIMTTNVNQALSNQYQVERIRAEELAKGAFWFNFVNLRTSNAAGIPSPSIMTVEGKEYTITQASPPGIGPNGTDIQEIRVRWQPQ